MLVITAMQVEGHYSGLLHLNQDFHLKDTGGTQCTTNACLALMNLSISKANKRRVFKTRGVMDSLMTVLSRTTPRANISRSNSNK